MEVLVSLSVRLERVQDVEPIIANQRLSTNAVKAASGCEHRLLSFSALLAAQAAVAIANRSHAFDRKISR